jgi:hypothetical protein
MVKSDSNYRKFTELTANLPTISQNQERDARSEEYDSPNQKIKDSTQRIVEKLC